MRNCLGIIDSKNTEWEEEFKGIVDLNSLRSHYLDDKELHLGRLDEASIKSFFSLLGEVANICTNDQGPKL